MKYKIRKWGKSLKIINRCFSLGGEKNRQPFFFLTSIFIRKTTIHHNSGIDSNKKNEHLFGIEKIHVIKKKKKKSSSRWERRRPSYSKSPIYHHPLKMFAMTTDPLVIDGAPNGLFYRIVCFLSFVAGDRFSPVSNVPISSTEFMTKLEKFYIPILNPWGLLNIR